MIVSFRPKGLEELYNKGKTRKIDQKFWPKLKIVFETLTRLESEEAIMAHPAWDTHKLHGYNPKGQPVSEHWSLKISGNWRLTYLYNNGNIELTDFMDYH